MKTTDDFRKWFFAQKFAPAKDVALIWRHSGLKVEVTPYTLGSALCAIDFGHPTAIHTIKRNGPSKKWIDRAVSLMSKYEDSLVQNFNQDSLFE